jgi:hypothetical protein
MIAASVNTTISWRARATPALNEDLDLVRRVVEREQVAHLLRHAPRLVVHGQDERDRRLAGRIRLRRAPPGEAVDRDQQQRIDRVRIRDRDETGPEDGFHGAGPWDRL